MIVAPSAMVANPTSELDYAFPSVDPGVRPTGSRVLLQIRSPKTTSKGGIILVSDTQDTEKWNTQVAKVLATGPLAFKNRETGIPWVEGEWASEGEFVRVPKYGGDRWELPVPGREEPALFVIVNDLDIVGIITGDPLAIRAFI